MLTLCIYRPSLVKNFLYPVLQKCRLNKAALLILTVCSRPTSSADRWGGTLCTMWHGRTPCATSSLLVPHRAGCATSLVRWHTNCVAGAVG